MSARDDLLAAADALYAEGASSRDAEVAGLKQRITELEAELEPPAAVTEGFADLSDWSTFDGANKYTSQGARLEANTTLDDGVMTVWCRPVTKSVTVGGHTLTAGDYAAGMAQHRIARGPGTRYTMQLRMDASVGTRAVALLWPYQIGWPEGGELDFVENGADLADRQSTAIANHWADAEGDNTQRVVKFPHDFTAWSDVEVLWKPGLFVVTVDGDEAARFTEHVPDNQMRLSIQTAVAGGGQAPTFKGAPRTPGCIQVRRLRIYDA